MTVDRPNDFVLRARVFSPSETGPGATSRAAYGEGRGSAKPRLRASLHQEAVRAGGGRCTILETPGLTKVFRGFVAVSNVNVNLNLNVRRGAIRALIGPDGAGKTTFFNRLTRFLEPTAGRILFNGVDITREKPADIARRGIIRSFQISAVFPHLTCSRTCGWRCSGPLAPLSSCCRAGAFLPRAITRACRAIPT